MKGGPINYYATLSRVRQTFWPGGEFLQIPFFMHLFITEYNNRVKDCSVINYMSSVAKSFPTFRMILSLHETIQYFISQSTVKQGKLLISNIIEKILSLSMFGF